jgi:hypothetical protein
MRMADNYCDLTNPPDRKHFAVKFDIHTKFLLSKVLIQGRLNEILFNALIV